MVALQGTNVLNNGSYDVESMNCLFFFLNTYSAFCDGWTYG